MKRLLVPTKAAADWQALLAEPTKHWKTGYSAKTLAHCWESASGFPSEIRRIFATAPSHELREPEMLFAIPEYQTDLPGGKRPSCSDVFALARSKTGLIAITIEGKVREEFGPLVGQWRATKSKGRTERWAFIVQLLAVSGASPDRLRYQLFHRTASAVLEAQRFLAQDAVMLVQSFSATNEWYDDFAAFVEFFGARPSANELIHVGNFAGIRLHLGWVAGNRRFLRA